MTARDRHPGEHRFHQVDQLPAGPILRLRSLGALCSLRHRRLLGPRCWGTLSWPTRFSRRPGSRRYSVLKFNRDRDIPTWLEDGLTIYELSFGIFRTIWAPQVHAIITQPGSSSVTSDS